MSRAMRATMLTDFGEPDDIARVVRFLASSDSAFMTGHRRLRGRRRHGEARDPGHEAGGTRGMRLALVRLVRTVYTHLLVENPRRQVMTYPTPADRG